jgi:thiamine monophosphate kinase
MTDSDQVHDPRNDRVNEKEILALAAAANGALPKNILIPPGDDMALVQLTSSQVLVAVDQVVAGRHFIANTLAKPSHEMSAMLLRWLAFQLRLLLR